jgi:hypothetical protein
LDDDADAEPSHEVDVDANRSDFVDLSDAEEPGLWDPHAGLKPSPLDGCTSDDDIEIEDDLLPHRAAVEVEESMLEMLAELEDNDPHDFDWLPPNERKKVMARKIGEISSHRGRNPISAYLEGLGKRKVPSFGPDVAAKSDRSRRRPQHIRALQNQTKLTSFLFAVQPSRSTSTSGSLSPASSVGPSRASSRAPSRVQSAVPTPEHSLSPAPSNSPPPSRDMSHGHSPSPLPPAGKNLMLRENSESHVEASELEDQSESSDNGQRPQDLEDDTGLDSEDEEDNVDSFLDAGGAEPRAKEDVRGWPELREQIKDDLRAASRQHASLTQINKLIILRNFATLQIKGSGRMAASAEIARQWHEGTGVRFSRRIRFLARYYQLFEQLPVEKRGGDRGHSLFNDERVQTAARVYLSGLATGEVTPRKFHHALNEQILPSLGYTLRDGLSERTARRWLVRLGWRRTRLKKGVYMDGHERPDVKEYRDKVFLPLMASYERRMRHWTFEGPEPQCIEPNLEAGEKRIIAVFQDESSFHANEYKQNIWCAP